MKQEPKEKRLFVVVELFTSFIQHLKKFARKTFGHSKTENYSSKSHSLGLLDKHVEGKHMMSNVF